MQDTSCWYRMYKISPEEHVLLPLCQQIFDQVQFLKMATTPDQKKKHLVIFELNIDPDSTVVIFSPSDAHFCTGMCTPTSCK